MVGAKRGRLWGRESGCMYVQLRSLPETKIIIIYLYH